MLVKRPVYHSQTASDLIGTPLQSRQGTGLLGAVAVRACIAAKLAADRGLVASNQAGDLRDAVLGFYKAGNLVSFNLGEGLVIHRATSTCRKP